MTFKIYVWYVVCCVQCMLYVIYLVSYPVVSSQQTTNNKQQTSYTLHTHIHASSMLRIGISSPSYHRRTMMTSLQLWNHPRAYHYYHYRSRSSSTGRVSRVSRASSKGKVTSNASTSIWKRSCSKIRVYPMLVGSYLDCARRSFFNPSFSSKSLMKVKDSISDDY